MKKTLALLISVVLAFTFCGCVLDNTDTTSKGTVESVDTVPKFNGMAYISINDGIPEFTEDEITDVSYEKYSALDYLGRCGTAMACIGKDLMPTEERKEIGMIKPTGWHTVKYDFVDGKYLYNRCHLIGFQLTGENANEQNLITGTRFLNIEGMLPFENLIADYIKETDNHVMYRVTPIFKGVNLLCDGIQLEGYSVEDKGEGVSFNVFAYNAQPQVEINYLTGESTMSGQMIPDEDSFSEISVSSVDVSSIEDITSTESADINSDVSSEVVSSENNVKYILNTSSKKIHLESCSHAKKIKEDNKMSYIGDITEYINKGYGKCQVCLKGE